ncbi:MAG: hydantoinase/oxoprolinase family protein [Bacillota bacterium]
MADLALGIDTGGTFTDGVVIDLNTEEIIISTKQVTTRDDLAIAIENCLEQLLKSTEVERQSIKLVSLSTTLATNAIVEGQGAEVGAILLGFEPDQKLPTDHYTTLAGGCTIKGKIKREINPDEIEKAAREMAAKVDAFAVCGYLSVRNPVQEQEAARIIRETTGYPVVQAHQLSSELGFHERAVTAVFNARLLPLITDLIDNVSAKMEEYEIIAPLMVVKGDGSLISEDEARKRPVETSLSGPAASAIGARHLAGIDDGLIIDIGGTTTDLALLRDGRPRLSEVGARVGGWLTRVKAAEITTIGLGGDSQIRIDKAGQMEIGPERIFPLAWAAEVYPHLISELSQIKTEEYFPLNHQPVSALIYIKEPVKFKMSPMQKQVMEAIKETPHTIKELGAILDIDPEVIPWKQLVKTGCLHRAGLTPTDMLHWRGEYCDWNVEAARLGVEITAKRAGITSEELVAKIKEEIEVKLGSLILESAVRDDGYELNFQSKDTNYFLRKLLKADLAEETRLDRQTDTSIINYQASLQVPLIGVGAPARAYFPGMVERLPADLYLPEWAEVANAVGTVMGKIVEQVRITIKPDEVGAGYAVYTPEKRLGYKKLEEAIRIGEKMGREYVIKQADKSRAKEVEVMVEREDKYGKFAGGRPEDSIFIETILDIAAIGKPW